MLSIIVLSSDGYSDCWIPFFKSIKKNFPEIDKYEILLSTNTKSFQYPGLNIITLANGLEIPWAKRLRLSLEQAKNEIVLILIEDLFLKSKINLEIFNELLILIKDSNKIDHIRLLSTRDRTKTRPSEFNHLDEIEQKTRMRFIYLPGLWKKKVLLKYVFDFENIFMSEKMGDLRSRIYKHKFYAISSNRTDNKEQFYDCRPSGGLFKGKWQNWVIPYFEENNIDIDFDKRGFITDEFIQIARRKSKLDMLRNPLSTFRSFFSIIVLFIKNKY